MDSITKTKISRDQIINMVKKAFGEDVELDHIRELTEGYFNTAYLIQLNNGVKSVLKVSPTNDVLVMSYEQMLMETEVFTLKRIDEQGDVPVPRVLYYGHSDELKCYYLFMEFIEGESLNNVRDQLSDEQYNEVAAQLGDYAKKINTIEGNYFGSISQLNKRFSTWSEAFLSMIQDLLDDAMKMNVSLPFTNDELYSLVNKYEDVLNKVNKPSLVHKDLWEGNIFYDLQKGKITGIIDCERALFGDPLLEPVCAFMLDNKNFMHVFTGEENLNDDESVRVQLYKLYLFLLMVTEGAYRQYSDHSIEEWAREQLNETLNHLINIV